MQVALSELLPEHQHAPAGPCKTAYDDWHPLRMAEYACPDALRDFYDANARPGDGRALAWAHTEQALVSKDMAKADRLLGAARAELSDGMEASRRKGDGGVGLSLLDRSMPLIRERIARNLEGEPFDSDSLERHAAAMAMVGCAALDKLVNTPRLDARLSRKLLLKGGAAVVCSLINRQKDPEFVAMPASLREERRTSEREIVVGHDVVVLSPSGKWTLMQAVQKGVDPITTVFGKPFREQIISLRGSQSAFDTSARRYGDSFYYVASMLKREALGNGDFDQRQAEQLQTLSSWLIDTTKAGVLFEQGNAVASQDPAPLSEDLNPAVR